MSPREPLFTGLVFNEEGEPVQSTTVGGEPFYAIPEDDFLRHIEAIEGDRQVIDYLKERIMGMKDLLLDSAMEMMGSDDPFTRAAMEMSLENMDQVLEHPEAVPLEDFRLGLWMTGFRVTVNFHGEVVHVELPGLEDPGE